MILLSTDWAVLVSWPSCPLSSSCWLFANAPDMASSPSRIMAGARRGMTGKCLGPGVFSLIAFLSAFHVEVAARRFSAGLAPGEWDML